MRLPNLCNRIPKTMGKIVLFYYLFCAMFDFCMCQMNNKYWKSDSRFFLRKINCHEKFFRFLFLLNWLLKFIFLFLFGLSTWLLDMWFSRLSKLERKSMRSMMVFQTLSFKRMRKPSILSGFPPLTEGELL